MRLFNEDEIRDMVEYNYNNTVSKLNTFFTKLGKFVSFIVVIAIIIYGAKSYLEKNKASDKHEAAVALSEFDNKISAIEIKHELEAIGELSTSKYTYSGQAFVKDYRELFGWDIPLTSHTICITYSGVIKVGYDVEDIEIEVSENTIILDLPSPRVLDNYIDDFYTEEENNIFNPIKTEEITEKLKEVKSAELEKGRDEAYEKAEKEVKKLILEILQKFNGYSVTFE